LGEDLGDVHKVPYVNGVQAAFEAT